MSWVTFAFAASLCWAVSNVADKYFMGKLSLSPAVPLAVFAGISACASLAVFWVHGLPSFSMLDLALIVLAGVCMVAEIFFYLLAARHLEISRVIALFQLTPLFVLVLAVLFLHEVLTASQYAGIALLVGGAILISIQQSFRFDFGRGF